MDKTTIVRSTVICAIAVVLVLAVPVSVTSLAAATPVDDSQTTAVTENIDVWERSVLPLRTSSNGPATIAAPQMYINVESASTGDVPLNQDTYTIHETDEEIDLTFESTTGAGTSVVAGEEAQLLAVKLSERPNTTGFSNSSVRTDLANIFTNDSDVSSVELLDDADGVGSIDDNGVLETTYTPDSGGAYGFILVTVDDGDGLSVQDENVSVDGNVTVVGVEQTLVQESESDAEITEEQLSAGDNVTLDIETDLEDDSVTHAVMLVKEDELQQRSSTVTVTGEIDENFSEEQVSVENSFDGVSGVSTVANDAQLADIGSTTAQTMPAAGIPGLFGLVLSEASPQSNSDDVLHASATTVSDDSDTTVTVETLNSWPNGTYEFVHIAVGEDSGQFSSDTGSVSLIQSNASDSDDNDDSDNDNDDSDNDNDDSDNDNDDSDNDNDDSDNDNDDSDNDNDDSDETTEVGTTEEDTDNGETTTVADTEDEETTEGGAAEPPEDDATATSQDSVETTSSNGPGFGVLVAVLALLGAGLLARRD